VDFAYINNYTFTELQANAKINFYKIDPFFTLRHSLHFSIKMLKSFKTENKVMCGLMVVCMCLCMFCSQEFLVDCWGQCSWVIEGAVDGLLLAMVIMVFIEMAHVYLQYMQVCGCTSSVVKWSHVL
jgi:hypothetical protein